MQSMMGVAAWLFVWVQSTGVPPLAGGASAAGGAYTEGEVWFAQPQLLSVPGQLPLEAGTDERYALLVWGAGGPEHACAYLSNGRVYQRMQCDVDPGGGVAAGYVGVFSDVEAAHPPGGGRIFIDFAGGGVLVSCGGTTSFLGDVDPAGVDLQTLCGG